MVTMRWNLLFFDAPRVKRAMSAATRRALGKVGAFIRTRARSSIRKRKGISQPGKPPHSHVGTLRNLLFFGVNPAATNVVIGPVGFKRGEAPRLLERGGTTTIRTNRRRRRVLHYRARPFMGPALAAEVAAGTIPKRWSNSIRAGE